MEQQRTRPRASSTDPEATIDLLKDRRFNRKDEWFGDLNFACKYYPYGGLVGIPKHCPDPKTVQKAVLDNVKEAEECESSDDEDYNKSTSSRDLENAKPVKEMSARSIFYRLATRPSMIAIRFLAWVLSKLWRAAFTSIHIHNADIALEAVRRSKEKPGTALIILPTHRSHADYLLMSYLFFGLNLPVPVIAAGENLNVPLLGSLLACAGAFFIRRSRSTPRYRLVLQAYMYELARSGVPIEFFIEGGRSRRGNVGKPKLGLLGMIIQMVRDGDLKDALLLPVSLDYDSVPEGNGFAQEVLGTAQKKPESLLGTIRAAIEWLIWGKRGGGVYVGFGDKVLSVQELIASYSKRNNLPGFGQNSRLVDPNLADNLRKNSSRKLMGEPQQEVNSLDVNERSKLLDGQEHKGGSEGHHQLHHHHAVPPPAAIFRGLSGTSLSKSVLDEDGLVQDIGRTVVDAQRDAALISVGGIASCAMLMHPPHGGKDSIESIIERSITLVNLLVELGHGHRIPDGTLSSVSMRLDIARAVETLGGPLIARSGGAKARVCLRYAAAPVIVRLLPVFVVCLKQKVNSDFHAWLAGMFDVEIRKPDDEEDEEEEARLKAQARRIESIISNSGLITADFRRDLVELIAPAVMILSTALQNVSHWRCDAVVTEEDAIKHVREQLANAPIPEILAPLEIAAAFRACVIHKVLKRIPVTPPQAAANGNASGKSKPPKEPKKVSGYELEPTYVAPLAKGRSAVLDARKVLETILQF